MSSGMQLSTDPSAEVSPELPSVRAGGMQPYDSAVSPSPSHAQACELCEPSLMSPLVLPFVSCLLTLAGVALAAWGIGIVNGLQWIEPLPAIVQDTLPGFLFPDPQLLVVGRSV